MIEFEFKASSFGCRCRFRGPKTRDYFLEGLKVGVRNQSVGVWHVRRLRCWGDEFQSTGNMYKEYIDNRLGRKLKLIK